MVTKNRDCVIFNIIQDLINLEIRQISNFSVTRKKTVEIDYAHVIKFLVVSHCKNKTIRLHGYHPS